MQKSWFEENAPMLKGAAGGAIAGFIVALIVVFKIVGSYTPAQAQRLADDRAEVAVNAALVPVCQAAFMQLPDAQKQLAALKAEPSYNRGDAIEKLVKIPGQKSLSYSLQSDCADKLIASMKSAQK